MTAMSCSAAARPGPETLSLLASIQVSQLSPSDLVDAVIASERLLSHVNALQARLLAELGRPQRCGDVTGLVTALIEKSGQCLTADGKVDDELVAELTRDRSVGMAAAEVAAVLDWAPVTARIRIEQSTRLLSALPRTFEALEQGAVDIGRTRMIVDRTAVLAPEACAGVECRVLPLVRGRSKGRLETIVDREVIIADPAAAENRRQKAVTDRGVDHRPLKDGMALINALLPADAAVKVFTLIDLIAEANKGLDDRTVDQRRADAVADIADELLTFGFVDLEGLVARTEQPGTDGIGSVGDEPGSAGNSAAANSPAADSRASDSRAADSTAGNSAAANSKAQRLARAMSRHGRRPHLNVTGALSTFAGLDNLPGQLDGHGVITAELLRSIASSWGTLTTIGVDPVTGTATAIGALTYRPGQRLADQVITLSGNCRAAGCRMPAWRCDLDHVRPFDHSDPRNGGKTELGNMIPACKFHHLLKHHSNWTPHLRPDRTVHWTTNTGHTAVSHPREFTLPGEWLRRSESSGDRHPEQEDSRKSGRIEESVHGTDDVCAEPPRGSSDDAPTSIIVGPTVAGPTIPVVPAGQEFEEPYTGLEDPDTVPHPGSVEIRTYRAVRRAVRDHALRRLSNLAKTLDPSEQRRRAFIAGRSTTIADEDLASNTLEHAQLTRNMRLADLRPPVATRPDGLNRRPDEADVPHQHPSSVSGRGLGNASRPGPADGPPTEPLPLDPPF